MAKSIPKLNSINDLAKKGPGLYQIRYTSGGRTFNFIVNIGKIDRNASVSLYGYGQNGNGNHLLGKLNNNNNGIDIIMQNAGGGSAYQTSGWQKVASSFIKDLSKNLGVNPNNTVLYGFSYSSEMTAKYAAQYAKNTGAKNFSAVISECSWGQPVKITNEERETLIKNNVTFFNVYQNKSRSMYRHISGLDGVHVIDVDIKIKNGGDVHGLPHALLSDYGINNLPNGGFDFTSLPSSYNFNGHKYNLEYKYTEHYIDENGNPKTRTLSAEEVQERVDEMYIKSMQDYREQHPELSDFAHEFPYMGDSLGSNLAFVSNSVDSIKGKITAHQDLNYQSSKSGEAGVIGAIYGASNYYGAVSNALYGNLSAEADAVYAIANAIYKMDGCGAVIAESGLTDAMKSMYSDSSLNTNIDALKKATSDLYDTAKSAVTAAGRYDDLANLLGSKITPGGVGNISITALESAINSVVPSLDAEIEKATQLKAGVSDFMSGIGSSNILQGGVWDDVKTNMSNYENLLDANAKAATFISDTLKTAMGIITDYVEQASDSISAVGSTEYSGLASAGELDDSKIPEIEKAIEEVKANIEQVETTIKEMEEATEKKCDPLPEGSTEAQNCYDVKKYTAADIQPYKDKLEKYKEVLETLNTYLGKLEGLAPVVQAAQEIIQSAIDQVKSMYENPVTDANGNQSFVADFKLDLSPYAEFMDITKDYKKLIDDYYEKLNPPAEEPKPEDPPAGDPPAEDPPTYYGPPAQDPPTITTEAPSETTTEETTEEATEEATEESTEESTEEETVPPITEPITDIQTEPETVPETKPVETEPEQEHGGGHEPKPPKPGVETEPVIMTEPEMFTEMETIPEEIYTEPEDYSEPFMEPDTEIFIDDDIIDDPLPEPQKKGNGIKTMGVAAGLGLAIGAAALGAHAIIKSKEDDDEESDYGYEK